jgi:hypothetical protein
VYRLAQWLPKGVEFELVDVVHGALFSLGFGQPLTGHDDLRTNGDGMPISVQCVQRRGFVVVHAIFSLNSKACPGFGAITIKSADSMACRHANTWPVIHSDAQVLHSPAFHPSRVLATRLIITEKNTETKAWA